MSIEEGKERERGSGVTCCQCSENAVNLEESVERPSLGPSKLVLICFSFVLSLVDSSFLCFASNFCLDPKTCTRGFFCFLFHCRLVACAHSSTKGRLVYFTLVLF